LKINKKLILKLYMDKLKDLPLNEKINQMKEDYNTDWWRPGKIDNYDLKNKVYYRLYIISY
jgi:hypothetical protein